MSCRVATFAEILSTKDIDICRKFNDIIAGANTFAQSDSAQEAERLVGSGGCEADMQMSY